MLLERLQASGEAERTLIVLSGDHGMPGVPSGKCNLYDHGTAVALVISTGKPRVAVPDVVNQTQAAATSTITDAGLVLGAISNATSMTVKP